MPGPILPISGVPVPEAIRPVGEPRGSGAFQDVLSAAIRNVEAFGQDASALVERFLSGEGEELHTTVLAAERAKPPI